MAVAALAAIALIAGVVGRPAAQTLEEALVQAYLNNPTLRAERARLRATDERVPQALSGWRPTVRLTGSAGENITDSRLGTFGSTGKRTVETAPTRFQFEVRQPVFRGLRTVSGTREGENLVLAGRARLTNTEQSVLFQAVTAHMDVVRDQAVVELSINNERVLARQLEATRDRFEVGEVTRTDVSQAESRLAGATGNRVAAEGDLAASRATYQNVIGRLPGRLVKPVVTLALPETLEDSTTLAQQENPNLVAARFDAKAASQRIKVVRGELLPELNVVGAVQRQKQVGATAQMSESVSVIAELAVPIYQSGSVQSRVREAKQVFGQRRVEIEQARRQAVEDAIQAWENLESARAQIRAFQAQVEATTIALDGVEQEATVGARTVLDILDAEQERLDAQVSLVRAERDEIVARFQLLQAVGRLTAEGLQLPVEYYDETRHYRQVRDKWFGLGPGQVDRGDPTVGAAPAPAGN
jgi:TolC family type I secretion outer membrane protein